MYDKIAVQRAGTLRFHLKKMLDFGKPITGCLVKRHFCLQFVLHPQGGSKILKRHKLLKVMDRNVFTKIIQ